MHNLKEIRENLEHFKTVSVPEFMRIYLQDKWDRTQTVCEKEDF